MVLVWILFGIAVIAGLTFSTGIFLKKRLMQVGGLLVVCLTLFLLLKQR